MERRRDCRQPLECRLTLCDPHSDRVVADLSTSDVSASGLRFQSSRPHGLRPGSRVRLRLVARVPGRVEPATLVMEGTARLIRGDECAGALRFDAPLTF